MVEGNIPTHIGMIMDGNRRWAREKGLEIKQGHKQGAKTLENIVRYAKTVGVKYISVFAFSTENWKRSQEEVGTLMMLLKGYLDDYGKRADTENIRIKVLGDITAVNEGLQKSIRKAEERTRDNNGIVLSILFNYGGRADILRATKDIAKRVKEGKLSIDDITEDIFSDSLYTEGMPDPDLVIRTSGEMRTSGFLTWQTSYSELLFLEKYWPDFSEEDLDNCIKEFQKRKRNFGAG